MPPRMALMEDTLMHVYFPSCNFTADSREGSARIKAYLQERHGMRIAACCRVGIQSLTPQDTAVTICQSCSAIVREASIHEAEISVFEILDADAYFPWPNLQGERMTLQDCWRAREKDSLHAAVRSIMKKMNLEIVELELNRRNTPFDGTFRMNPMREANLRIAPEYYGPRMDGQLELCSPEEQQRRMETHARQIQTGRVACYCNACCRGLLQGGANAVHLMDLIMGLPAK